MPPISKLPDDLLIEIFAQSVAHTHLFNPSLASGPHSPWARALRHKKVLVSVCKRWHLHGIPFLYRQVIIRRANQLSSLKWTLSQVTTRGSKVLEFCVAETCYVHNGDGQRFYDTLAEILLSCPNVNTLEIRPLFTLKIPRMFDLTWNSQIQLDLGSTPKLASQLSFLTFFSGRVRAFVAEIRIGDQVSSDRIHFPCLEELQFNLRGRRTNGNTKSFDFRLPLTWSLPMLRSLRIRSENNSLSPYAPTLPFVQRHGSRLLHLGIHRDRGHDQESYGSTVTEILKHCPNVRHLSLDILPVPSKFPTCNAVFPSIRVLDVFAQGSARDQTERLIGPPDAPALTFFPSLKFLTFFSYFPVDGFLALPLPKNADATNVFCEACSWLDVDQAWTQVKIADYKLGTRDGECSLQIIHPKEGGDPDDDLDDLDFIPLAEDDGGLSLSSSDSDEEEGEGESLKITSEEIQDLDFL